MAKIKIDSPKIFKMVEPMDRIGMAQEALEEVYSEEWKI